MQDDCPFPAALLATWLAQSSDLLAVTDASGALSWTNARFTATTGASAGMALLSLTGEADACARTTLAEALRSGTLAPAEIDLRSTTGQALVVRIQASSVLGQTLWTLEDRTPFRELEASARHQVELLDMAREFGRLGVWERDIASGVGHWDRHVFGFWGLDPSQGTPRHEDAIRYLHPDDRDQMAYLASTRAAGRYAQRFRVLRPDGTTRWLHSEWEVKASAQGMPVRAIGIMVDDTVVYNSARALGEANARLELAVELGRITIWRHDLKTQRLHYNDRGISLLDVAPRPDGVPVEELLTYIHPDDVAIVLASAQRALASDKPTDTEARYRRADGSWRYVLTRCVVQRDAADKAIAFIGVALDVTERVEHLRANEELARRMDSAARAARVGIWTASILPGDTDWNEQMFELFDWPKPAGPPTLSAWVQACVHPLDQERVGSAARAYLRGGDRPFEVEFRTVRRDGSNRWIKLRADVDQARSDQRRMVGVALDVTAHHQALADLQEASERAALITRHAGIGIWEVAVNGGPERWDAQMFHLRGLPAVAGESPSRTERLALVHPEDRHLLLDAHDDHDNVTSAAAYEYRVRLPDGSYRWIASRSAVVRDERGVASRRVGVNWDVTEARNVEAARRQAELAEREIQAKSQFLSRMSHELSTPLNAVLGFTQLLQIETGQAVAAGQVAKLGHIRAAGEHLLALINDVLDLSNLESGELKLQLQSLDLATLIKQTLPLVEPLAAQHGVILEMEGLGGVAHADPKRLRQVLINLFSNAVKFNRRGGRVRVGARAEGERVILTVGDTGRGLAPEQIAHLFEPFNRLGIESEGIEGTGIGLTIVRALVEGMGGTVSVTSKRGEGTLFEVRLPADSSGADTAAPPPEPVAVATPRCERSGQLLYIEDNAVNVMLVEELVRTLSGLQIASEATGAAGVRCAKTLRPDVILIDLQLPDFDGFEVLRRLRAQPETAATPCIALSANAMPEDIARGMAAGFTEYWTKPIDFKIFLAGLEKLFPATA